MPIIHGATWIGRKYVVPHRMGPEIRTTICTGEAVRCERATRDDAGKIRRHAPAGDIGGSHGLTDQNCPG